MTEEKMETKRGLKKQLLQENISDIVDMDTRGYTGNKIAEEMTKRLGIDVKQVDISKVLVEEKAKAYFYSTDKRKIEAGKVLGELNRRYEDACRIVDWLVQSIEKIKRNLETLPPEQEAIQFIKLTPMIIQTSREILNQLQFIREEQEKIKVQQNNMILSPIQVNIEMTKKLKDWNEKGYIKIMKILPKSETFGIDVTGKEEIKHSEEKEEDEEKEEEAIAN
jgi:NACalpha-BTF3-like transcription factor